MNRSSKGFGLTGVFVAVVILIISAVLSTAVSSDELNTDTNGTSGLHHAEHVSLALKKGTSRFSV